MKPLPHNVNRGTVTLVALCFVTVLGITLAGYIAVCSRAMTLSNRSYQDRTSLQLAEMGIDEALRAFNKNNWTTWTNGGITVTWDTSTYAASKRAVATISFPTGKFGQGVTGSVKVRVDNYDANQLNSSWSSSANYRINDLVGSSGVWYRCVQINTNQTPNTWANLAYWVPVPMGSSWSTNITYSRYDVVNYNGVWYRYTNATATSGNLPTNISYWSAMSGSGSLQPWSASTTYSQNTFVFSTTYNAWYRYINASPTSGSSVTNATYWSRADSGTPTMSLVYNSSTSYGFGDIVYNNTVSPTTGAGTWFRCIAATNPGYIPTAPDSNWEYARSGSMWGWNSGGIKYNLGDVVYYSTAAKWYRCVFAHTSSATYPPDSTTYPYWSSAPLFSTAWESGKQYSINDTVRYNGVWYRCIATSTAFPPTNTTYWIGANTATTSYQWNATSSYTTSDYRCYGGVWYKCNYANTGHSPNETPSATPYWTPTWANSFGVTTGAPVVYAEGTIAITGNPSVKTQLRATIAPAPLFPNVVGAATDLTITTGTGTVDSYDSSVAAYSAGTAGYSAVLAAGGTLAINGTTAVKGYLAWPSPPAGISTGTTVKSSTSPASPNVDTSRVSRSPSIPQFDPLPSGGLTTNWSTVPKGTSLDSILGTAITIDLGTPGATTPSRYYVSGNMELGTIATTTTVNINGPVILHIDGYLRLRGSGNLYINSAGSAEIHVGTYLYLEAGSITNQAPSSASPDPKKLILICDGSSSTAQTYAYSSNLHGVIYMPNTTNTSGLAIGSGINIYGALSAKKTTFNYEANLHYDTSLRYATFGGVDQPYTVTDWRELDVTEQATMP